MSVPVFFVDARSSSSKTSTVAKIARILKAAALDTIVGKDDLAAIKIHFGETGNDAYVSPVFARVVADAVRQAGGKPYFTDTNTLYSGTRHNAVDHLETAILHGFDRSVCGAPVLIADGLRGEDYIDVKVGLTHFDSVKIARGIHDADAMVLVSHFKGHEAAGFGGAIKNLAMGCAPPAGKREQHACRYRVNQANCIGCGACAQVCPAGAIDMHSPASGKSGKTARIRREDCIGCAECSTHCPQKTIDLDWGTDLSEFARRMVEYAYGAVANKKGKLLYITLVTNVVPDCDCAPWSDAAIVVDQGILVSTDPVAIDQAALDLVSAAPPAPGGALDGRAAAGDDKFSLLHPQARGSIQLSYGDSVGLGSRDYELIRIGG